MSMASPLMASCTSPQRRIGGEAGRFAVGVAPKDSVGGVEGVAAGVLDSGAASGDATEKTVGVAPLTEMVIAPQASAKKVPTTVAIAPIAAPTKPLIQGC